MTTDDDFESTLRAELADVASHIRVPAGLATMVRASVRRRERRRVAVRTGGVGLAGIVAVGGLVWTRRGDDPARSISSAPATTVTGSTVASTVAGPTTTQTATTTESSAPALGSTGNVLIVGVDSNACIDPSSPYAGGIGDRTGLGQRADTIMVLHTDASTGTATLLSLPRDLFVDTPGGGKGRLNATVRPGGYDVMAQALDDNFGIRVDHYVQIDFCGFTRIVDALGGITVPIPAAMRDRNVGLDLAAGCHTLTGDEALAYVRARHVETQDADGVWHADPTSDFGRIARQQDFVRRALEAVVDKGVLAPAVAGALVQAMRQYVVIDDGLSIDDMIALARQVTDANLVTTQLPARPAVVAGSAVLIADPNDPATAQALAVFTGTATSILGTPADTTVADAVVPAAELTC